MKEPPHLAAHVQRLSISSDFEIFSMVSDMKLSRLQAIQISSTEDGGLDGSDSVQAVSVEGIRHVLLCGFDRLAYASLIGILDMASLWEGLHFQQCSSLETEAWDQPAAHTSASAKITHLSLRSSGSIAEWFIRPNFPLDYTNLIYADNTASTNGAVAAVLERCLTKLLM
ncbi:hypothetical protein FB451DRAFT_1405386 [Mycena latifolia]|nr:hypothetical protein FB451DRAFT_1405386 [Mycena latifolia]